MQSIYEEAEALHIPRFLLHAKRVPFLTASAFNEGYCSDFEIYFYVYRDQIRTVTRVKTKMSRLDYYEAPEFWYSFTEAVHGKKVLHYNYCYDISTIASEYKDVKDILTILNLYLPKVLCDIICDYQCSKTWNYYKSIHS